MFKTIRFLIFCLNASSLFSKELFVDAAHGSDATSGDSRSSAFATIQKGVDALTPGDTLTILPGVYYEHVLMRNAGREDARLLIRADKIQKGRVVITGSLPAFREGRVVWKLEDKELGLYSTAFPHRPYRLLVDGNDLFAYDDLDGLKRFRSWLDGKPSEYPGPSQGFAWVKSEEKLYVRLHASGRYGKPDPNGRSFGTSPTYTGTKNEPGLGPDYGFAVWPKPNGTSAWLLIEGITFETPALCGVNTSAGDLIVRNCWFIGCRSGVQGSGQTRDQKDSADRVLVENCEYHQFPAFDDMEEVIRLYENDAWRGERTNLNQKIYWWHRKNKGTGLWAYENGIVLKAGADWVVRRNWIHDAFEAVTGGGGPWSRNLRVEENLIERMIDNAFETEDHSQGFQARSNFIVDVFEPVSWQPLDGEPYPGSIIIEDNRFYVTPQRWNLWTEGARGIFKIGQERAPRPKSGEAWAPASASGTGFVARRNFV
ncbi:MAG: hypothetical protein JNM63_13050, partial [Spirochaetia bacterium]|nr:hypothetical protein [Spirochaetia bacterium]